MSRTCFFQQNDTKINDFDEGVLILEPFSKCDPFVSKVTFEVGRNFFEYTEKTPCKIITETG